MTLNNDDVYTKEKIMKLEGYEDHVHCFLKRCPSILHVNAIHFYQYSLRCVTNALSVTFF